jgi:4-hydroxy-2-oxoheptanedioate aldolase
MYNVIKPNRVKELLKKGKVAVGLESFSTHASLVEIMGWVGFDFCFIDTEHCPADVGATLNPVRACEITGMTPIVRVYENSPALICKALDNGAQGVIVPHVNTVADAEAVVSSVKYAPEGIRSCCPAIRSDHFGCLPWKEYCRKANEDNLVILLLEGEEGIKNARKIVKVKGVDIILFGPVDLSQCIGLPGASYDHPKLYKALQDMVKMCDESGVAVMTVTTPLSNIPVARKLIEAGVKVVVFSSDVIVFRQACQELIKIKKYI